MSSRAEVVDLEGGFLLPGFGDGHAHPMKAGVASTFAPIAEQTSIPGELVAEVTKVVGAGFQPHVHGIRDAGIRVALATSTAGVARQMGASDFGTLRPGAGPSSRGSQKIADVPNTHWTSPTSRSGDCPCFGSLLTDYSSGTSTGES